jgi:methyl-accepting chemotaxis protein
LSSQGSFTIIIATLIALLLGLSLAIIISRNLGKPIKELSETADEVTKGNLDVNIIAYHKDEIGNLSNSLKAMVLSIRKGIEELNKEKAGVERKVEQAVKESEEHKNYLTQSVEKMLVEIKKFSEGDLTINLKAEKDDDIKKLYDGFNKSVKNISSLIVNVTEAVQATASASTQISSSTEELAAGAQEQGTQTTEVASAVEEMTKTIIETTTNATRASESAKTSGNIAHEGGKVVSETIAGMNKIAEVVTQAAETVKELGSNSDKIGEIIQVIDDIADQTNLLALNAAIEAARAGEQGRGFAVVADEVRKLAERTTKATKEIAAMIKQIQKDTSNAVVSMEKGMEEVNSGKQLAEKAGESLNQIINSSKEVIDNITQVAAASEEQSSAAEQISKNIESISSVTQQSSSGTQEIARAAEDLSRLTDNLQNLVSRFKIEDGDNKTNYAVRQNGKLVVA